MSGRRILVVDDELHIRQILRLHLEAAGFEIHEAVDGGSAVAQALQDPPELVILDLGLPDISGLDVLRRLAGEATTAQVPVLILTALGDEDARYPGVVGIITKPFSGREIVTTVQRVLDARSAA